MQIPTFAPGRLAGLVAGLATRGLEVLAKFGLYALAARLMGASESGAFFLCLGVVHLTGTAARLGLERPLMRDVAAERALGHGHAARVTAIRAIGLVEGFSLAAGLLLALTAPLLADLLFHQPRLTSALRWAALVLPMQNLAFALAYLLMGLGRPAGGQMVMSALAPLVTLAALALGVHQLDALLAAYAGAYAICVVLGVALAVRDWRRLGALGESSGAPSFSALISGARPLLVVELTQAAQLSAPVVALGHFATTEAVSTFTLANRISLLATLVVLNISTAMAPAFAAYWRRGDFVDLRASVRQATWLSIAFGLPLIVAMALCAEPLLSLFGVASGDAVETLWLLLIGQAMFCLFPSRDMLLAMTGHGAAL